MELPDFAGDPFHQAFMQFLSKRERKAARARSARRRGDDDRAGVLEAHVADDDERLDMLRRYLKSDPKWTRDSFDAMLRLAKQEGCDQTLSAIVALEMVVELAQTVDAYERNEDLAGLIESSRVAPLVLTPEEELRLWNERALSIEEEQELWRQGMNPTEVAVRVFPHRLPLLKSGGRALSPRAQVEYAEEMARRSDPNYDPIALRRLLYPDAQREETDAPDAGLPAAGANVSADRPAQKCTTPNCRMCRLTLGDPDQTRLRLREVLDLVEQRYHSTTLCERWHVSPSTIRDWTRAARHRRDLGTL